jgi:hypothetical protein
MSPFDLKKKKIGAPKNLKKGKRTLKKKKP